MAFFYLVRHGEADYSEMLEKGFMVLDARLHHYQKKEKSSRNDSN